MKELTIEEKAQRYDEIIEGIQEILSSGQDSIKMSRLQLRLQGIIPELKGDNDDKVLGTLIRYFEERQKDADNDELFCGLSYNSILTCLKKQSEHANFCNKIQVGDRVTRNEAGILVNISQLNRTAKQRKESGKRNPVMIQLKFKIGDIIKRRNSSVTYTVTKIDTSCFQLDGGHWLKLDRMSEFELVDKKTTDKVEPKFKIEKDKWYVCISQYCNCIEGKNYKASLDGRIIDDYGTEYDMHNDAYRWFRPWTIQEAKDGDVLAYPDGSIVIFNHRCDNSLDELFMAHVLYIDGHIETNNSCVIINATPATKEQRHLIFQNIKEAGYWWDAEKKELKKIEHESTDNPDSLIEESNQQQADALIDIVTEEKDRIEYKKGFECGKQRVLKYPEDFGLCKKIAWSEEDERNLNEALSYIKDETLKTFIKNRVQP